MRALAVVVAAVLLWPAAASAADFGGGRVPDTVVSLRTDADAVVVRAHMLARCGAGAVRRRVRARSPTGRSRSSPPCAGGRRDDRRVRRVARFALAGRVVGATASGTARVRLTFRRGGRVVGRCAQR